MIPTLNIPVRIDGKPGVFKLPLRVVPLPGHVPGARTK